MSNIDRTLKHMRPSIRLLAPQSYWFSFGFGVFNLVIGTALLNFQILVTLQIVSILSLSAWAIIFIIHGVSMLLALLTNNWKVTKFLNVIGVAIKFSWWLELVAITVRGHSPFLLYVWSLLLFLQFINYKYFMPRKSREQ